MVWKTMKPFLNERIRSKVCFIDEFTLELLQENGVFLDSLPREFGGGPEAFSLEEGKSK